MNATRFIAGVGAAAIISACASRTTDSCRPNVCKEQPSSSPAIEGTSFWQMHLIEPAIPESVQVTGAHSSGGSPMLLQLAPSNDRLQGVDPGSKAVMAEHAALVDAQINVTVAGLPYEILVKHVVSSEQSFWAGTSGPLEVYDLRYRSPGSEVERRLCPVGGGGPSQSLVAVGGAPIGWLSVACGSLDLAPANP